MDGVKRKTKTHTVETNRPRPGSCCEWMPLAESSNPHGPDRNRESHIPAIGLKSGESHPVCNTEGGLLRPKLRSTMRVSSEIVTSKARSATDPIS
jgi:hypothetical protein